MEKNNNVKKASKAKAEELSVVECESSKKNGPLSKRMKATLDKILKSDKEYVEDLQKQTGIKSKGLTRVLSTLGVVSLPAALTTIGLAVAECVTHSGSIAPMMIAGAVTLAGGASGAILTALESKKEKAKDKEEAAKEAKVAKAKGKKVNEEEMGG